jgi:hypothetical protein
VCCHDRNCDANHDVNIGEGAAFEDGAVDRQALLWSTAIEVEPIFGLLERWCSFRQGLRFEEGPESLGVVGGVSLAE